MEQPNQQQQPPNREGGRAARGVNPWFFILLIAIFLAWSWVFLSRSNRSEISQSYFEKLIVGEDYDGNRIKNMQGEEIQGSNILEVLLKETTAEGIFKVRPPKEPEIDKNGDRVHANDEQLKKQFVVNIAKNGSDSRKNLEDLLRTNNVKWSNAPPSNWNAISLLVMVLFSLGLLFLMFYMLRRAQGNMLGGGGFLSNFSRSPAKRYEATERPITFKDVAGLQSVKKDLQEIVEFLKDPTKFQRLGGRVPKGVLLIGPPGTGKTLLAKAVAGEADVPYFSVNGSEFIQMFVGVGASRVRDLFSKAKENAPSIIFVDEIDAVGRQRGAGLGGGHDEREQTLNQILSEMDGFQGNDSTIVIAATNRPDILDPALLRPGRFDRHVTVSRPTQKGRLAIFKVHVRDVPLGADVDLDSMASATAGMTGADIQNLVNEAALWAARHEKSKVEMEDFYYAHDKVLMGAKREEVLSEKEKERTAYHEAGHTIAAWHLKGAHPVHKVTIIPRGQALGVTQMVPEEDRMNISEKELRDQLVVLLSGRAAEQIVYDEHTVGAENDLERATSLARRMVTHWGMSERLGPVSYKMTDDDPFLGREMHKSRTFSEHTMEVIDEEVTKILQDSAQKSINLLNDHREHLEIITQELIKHEELDQKEIRNLIGKSVHDDRIQKNRDSEDDDGMDESASAPSDAESSDAQSNGKPEDDGQDTNPPERVAEAD